MAGCIDPSASKAIFASSISQYINNVESIADAAGTDSAELYDTTKDVVIDFFKAAHDVAIPPYLKAKIEKQRALEERMAKKWVEEQTGKLDN